MSSSINIDYILYVDSTDNKFVVKEYPIECHHEIIETLSKLAGEKDVPLIDLYNQFKKLCPIRFWWQGYCLKNECGNVAYTVIKAPSNPVGDYMKILNDKKSDCIMHFKELREREIEEGCFDEKAHSEALREELEKCKEEANEQSKEYFIRAVEEAMPAINFELALEELRSSVGPTVYSTDYKGWKTDFHVQITDDLDIIVKTNFCYGRSSYFIVSLRYKGIDILPYSFLTKYRYAKMIDLVYGTRSYSCKRENWKPALDFAVMCATLSADNPEQFVKKFVFSEVESMMSGLRSIIEDPETALKEMIEFADAKGDLAYNSVENVSILNCLVRDDEIVFAAVAEKVTGALKFIHNLLKLDSCFGGLQTYISEIRSMNEKLLPEFIGPVRKIGREIKKLEAICDKDDEAIKSFCDSHPKFKGADRDHYECLKQKRDEDYEVLRKRTNFKKLLERYQSRIVDQNEEEEPMANIWFW